MKPSRLQKHLKTQNDDDQRSSTEDIDVIWIDHRKPPRHWSENIKKFGTKENREPKFTAPPPPLSYKNT